MKLKDFLKMLNLSLPGGLHPELKLLQNPSLLIRKLRTTCWNLIFFAWANLGAPGELNPGRAEMPSRSTFPLPATLRIIAIRTIPNQHPLLMCEIMSGILMILSEAAVHSCIFRNKHFYKNEHMPYETLEQNPQNDIRDML